MAKTFKGRPIIPGNLEGEALVSKQPFNTTMGAGAIMGMNLLGVGFKAMLFSDHVDSIAAGGLIMDSVWNDRNVITVDLLGDEFMNTVKNGDKIKIHKDGTVEVG